MVAKEFVIRLICRLPTQRGFKNVRKPLTTLIGIATLSLTGLILGGCSNTGVLPDWEQVEGWLPGWVPHVFKIDVPQGNIVTQEMVNQLKPGMNKRQVLFVMGTPMLTDTFHPERWDYVYRIQPGGESAEQFRITLYFQDETLAGMEGDLRPMSAQEMAQFQPEERQRSVVVPLKDVEEDGLFKRALKTVGLGAE
ncbi:MAG: outer membrane protein assembly factor BamE [Gammaproteobacteria bacterium]|nr:outer membrane protein assembly factor BamE [Gammaproteobacteria bacterium]MCP5137035.1 outer membrane protein assembly factor BamE [Gammaproteobacteria bacterium]